MRQIYQHTCLLNTHTVEQVNNINVNLLVSNVCESRRYKSEHCCGMYYQTNMKIYIFNSHFLENIYTIIINLILLLFLLIFLLYKNI